MLPDDHDAHRADQAVRVHHLPQVRAHLCEPARGDAHQDCRRAGGDPLQGGRVHHQAGRHGRHLLHHQQGQGKQQQLLVFLFILVALYLYFSFFLPNRTSFSVPRSLLGGKILPPLPPPFNLCIHTGYLIDQFFFICLGHVFCFVPYV